MSFQTTSFQLTGSILSWVDSADGTDGRTVFIDDELISRVIIPKELDLPCTVRLKYFGDRLELEGDRRECLSALALRPIDCGPATVVDLDSGYDSRTDRERLFLGFLERLGQPKLAFQSNGEVELRPIWRFRANEEGQHVPDPVIGNSYRMDGADLIESYRSGRLWLDRSDDSRFQTVERELHHPKVVSEPLGAVVIGNRVPFTGDSKTLDQTLLIGDAWGITNDVEVKGWTKVPLIGRSAELIGTPATPPEDYVPPLE